jgi:hypothetical protein
MKLFRLYQDISNVSIWDYIYLVNKIDQNHYTFIALRNPGSDLNHFLSRQYTGKLIINDRISSTRWSGHHGFQWCKNISPAIKQALIKVTLI